MQPVLLLREGDLEPVAKACGKCGRVYALGDGFVERCCAPVICECGAEARKGWTVCDACRHRKSDEKEAARRAAATVVEWDGNYLYDAQGDRWFVDESEMLDAAEESGFEYAYASYPKPLTLNAEAIVDSALEDHYEEAEVDPPLVQELQDFLDDWCKRTGIVTYYPDYSRVVLVPTEAEP
jgi:hypothetical protein